MLITWTANKWISFWNKVKPSDELNLFIRMKHHHETDFSDVFTGLVQSLKVFENRSLNLISFCKDLTFFYFWHSLKVLENNVSARIFVESYHIFVLLSSDFSYSRNKASRMKSDFLLRKFKKVVATPPSRIFPRTTFAFFAKIAIWSIYPSFVQLPMYLWKKISKHFAVK